MSTRAVIARSTGQNCFTGRYHHFDGYPSGLGRTLYRLYHQVFDRDLDRMQRVLLDEHPAGWSTIVADWSQPIGFRSFGLDGGPQCYCHGERHEPAWELTEATAEEANCEYAYVLTKDEEGQALMRILCLASPTQRTETGWVPVAEVLLNGAAPDWEELDKAEQG